ncbi:hypothetical protein EC991_001590 [Linnemannia zychae]|nr:hypothetical protein EC991_001590 [Linnemannia zychae]
MYTKCDIEADQWLNSNPSKMWALDAEWRPFTGNGKQGKMALIQLGDDKVVYLFHVIHMKKFPEALARILQDSHIFKVGINIQNDARKMFKDWGVGCASLIELGALSIQVQDDLSSQRKIRSMERLTKELLQHDVEKVPLTRMGNWESKCLSASQLEYAANDAFVTYEVAEKIKELQRTRAKQDYILPLAKVHSEGTTVVTVRGSLQERLDRPATVEDIISPVPKQTATAAKATRTGVKSPSVVTGYAKVSKNKVTMAKAKAAGLGQASKRRNVIAAAPVASSATWLARSAKPALKAKTKKSARFSTSATALADNNKSGQNDSLSRKQRGKNNRREGGVFFPSGLLPESLEGKDVLERNQSVWLEAGGRDLSEDSDVEVGVEDQDGWHLRQNQALFASLITPDPDPDLDLGVTSGSKSGSDLNLKDLESVLDKDVLFSSLRKKT